MSSRTHWIIEGRVDPRWPVYTRGNVGEVFPEVITPLSYHLGVTAAERAWRDAYRRLGVATKQDFDSDEPVILGLFGGYCYLNLSYLRMLGVRAPGSSAEAIDVSLFGEGEPPPYRPHKGDRNLLATARILRTVLRALGTRSLPPVAHDSFRRAAEFAATRPSLDAPDEALLAHLYSSPAAFEPVFGNHIEATSLAGVIAGVLADATAQAGDPALLTDLVGAVGDVRSARYSQDLYEVAKTARRTSAVDRAFDEGIEGLLDRLAGVPEAADFLGEFAHFIETHGHRGPNDWEISARTWENTPELALVALDRMRVAEHDLTPVARTADGDARRQAAAERIRPHLGRLDRMNFDKALLAIPHWTRAREMTRDRAIRFGLPLRQVFRELVRRGAERGGSPDATAVALLDPYEELPAYLADPSSLLDTIATRRDLRDRLAAVEPPFFITSQHEVPTVEDLEAAQSSRGTRSLSSPGDVLRGDPGSSGVARGRARVVLDPADAFALEPGDVLVAPLTDPSWTPLFLPASAVVVNVGALMSHAVIVSRELAIPCVVAVDRATERIPDGAMVEVDGTAGTVTVLDS
jgi:phosphohistidine swiveling domain-containing protein